jgi:type I restriction enzyme, S subunit
MVELPRGWGMQIAADFCTKVTDGTHNTPEKKNNGKYLITSRHLKGNKLDFNNAYFISGQDFDEINKRSGVNQWDVIFSMIGTVGETYIEKKSNINYAIKNVGLFKCGNNELKGKWLFYYLKSRMAREYMRISIAGTTQEYMTLESLRHFPISYPKTESEIKQIVEVIDCLQNKIELNQEMNATLEKIGQALFKRWFINFEFPDEKGKPYKSSGGKMVDSELGEIPKEWRVHNLIEIVRQLKPGTNYQPRRVDKGIPFVNVKNIQNGFLDLTDVKFITEDEYIRVHNSWIPEEHDILLTRIGTLGNVGVIICEDLPVAVHYNSIDVKPRLTSFQFLYFLFKSEIFQAQYHLVTKQSVQEYVTIDEVEKLLIALPNDLMAINSLETTFISIFSKLEANTLQIRNLTRIRDSLLPRLMSGKIRVGMAK